VINLALRDTLNGWGKFLFTGLGLGLLVGVTLTMAGVYRGMVDDGRALLANSGADLWAVQQHTLGPYAEASSIDDDLYRGMLVIPGVAAAANVTYLTMQLAAGGRETRAMVVGIAPGSPGTPGWPGRLVAGRHLGKGHYEAVVDSAAGFAIGDVFTLRGQRFRVVGLTRRMVSSSGDPMVFIPLADAQDAQFDESSAAVQRDRRRGGAIREGASARADGGPGRVNAVLLRLDPGVDPVPVAEAIRRWQQLTVYTREEMEALVVGKLIATSAKQIGLFLAILALVSAAIVAFIIYSLTLDKLREIAVLKLIGARSRTIAAMIMQQALVLGIIGFAVGKVVATVAAPWFPKYVLLLPGDTARGFVAVLALCMLASLVAIRVALRVDPAEAIG
jgi:putative ABC transport system permease protein